MKNRSWLHLILLSIEILLTACSAHEKADYFNTQDGCLLGGTYYNIRPGIGIQCWNAGWEKPYDGLCRDPLCSHDSSDSLCPSSANLWQKTVATDGTKLYMNALNPLLLPAKRMFVK